jgi:uncharacterized protein YuzE
MKVRYDKEQDILYVLFNDEAVFESDEEKKGVIFGLFREGALSRY